MNNSKEKVEKKKIREKIEMRYEEICGGLHLHNVCDQQSYYKFASYATILAFTKFVAVKTATN